MRNWFRNILEKKKKYLGSIRQALSMGFLKEDSMKRFNKYMKC